MPPPALVVGTGHNGFPLPPGEAVTGVRTTFPYFVIALERETAVGTAAPDPSPDPEG